MPDLGTAPRLSAAQARAAARDRCGIDGEATELGSFEEQNFRIDASEGHFVLKVADISVPVAELDLQDRVLEHVHAALGTVVPCPIRRPGGPGADAHFRLLTYVEGEPLANRRYLAPPVLRAAGRLAGSLAAALTGFSHESAGRSLRWNVRRAREVFAELSPFLPDEVRSARAGTAIADAFELIEQLDDRLPWQVVHGDLSQWNLVAVGDRAGRPLPLGVIDFGDVVHTWCIAECGVLAMNILGRASRTSLQDAVEVVRGFNEHCPLDPAEVEALPAVISARAALSATICTWRAQVAGDKPAVMQFAEPGWERLERVLAIPRPLLAAAMRDACGQPRRVKQLPRASVPIVALEARPVRPIDFSPGSDSLQAGRWSDPGAIAAAIETLSGRDQALVFGRHGEARIVDEAPSADGPATIHLGVDLFLPEGTAVSAPVAATVLARTARELRLEIGGGAVLRLTGINSGLGVGESVRAGEHLGGITGGAAHGALPVHLHVQLCASDLDELPGRVPASLASAWLELSPDPGPVLGLPPDGRHPPP
ncbi:MAG: phosphotransferase [Gaiellaceae bacterium]